MLSLKKIFYGVAGAVPKLGSILGLVAPNFVGAMVTLEDGAQVAVDASLGTTFVLTCASDAVRELQPPTNGVAGQSIIVRIINLSGGNLTQTTFDAAIRGALASYPTANTSRDYVWAFNGVDWQQSFIAGPAVPV